MSRTSSSQLAKQLAKQRDAQFKCAVDKLENSGHAVRIAAIGESIVYTGNACDMRELMVLGFWRQRERMGDEAFEISCPYANPKPAENTFALVRKGRLKAYIELGYGIEPQLGFSNLVNDAVALVFLSGSARFRLAELLEQVAKFVKSSFKMKSLSFVFIKESSEQVKKTKRFFLKNGFQVRAEDQKRVLMYKTI